MPYRDPEVQKAWYEARKQRNKQLLAELKSKPCTDCGKTYPPYVMEFDHVPGRGEKKMNVASLGGSRRLTAKSFVDELKKCDLVCCNCHRIRTFTRK